MQKLLELISMHNVRRLQ